MSYQVTLEGIGTYPIRTDGFSCKLSAGAEGKHQTSSCTFSVGGRELISTVMLTEDLIDAQIADNDGTVLFTGVIRPYATVTAKPMELGDLELEVLDYTERMHKLVYADLSDLEDVTYSDTVIFEQRMYDTSVRDIAETLIELGGITDYEIPEGVLETVLEGFILEEGKYLDEVLADLLYEFCFDYRFDANGRLLVYQTGTVRNFTVDEDGVYSEAGSSVIESKGVLTGIVNTLSIERADDGKDGCVISYKKRHSLEDVQVCYTKLGEISSATMPVYGERTKSISGTTVIEFDSDSYEAYCEGGEDFIYAGLTWSVIKDCEHGGFGWSSCSIKSQTVTVTDNGDCSLTVSYDISVKFSGTSKATATLYLSVYADKLSWREDTSEVGYAGEDSDKYSAEYLETVADAVNLAACIEDRQEEGAYTYSFQSVGKYEVGDVWTLEEGELTGVSQDVRITERTLADDTGVYSYKAEGYGQAEFTTPHLNKDDTSETNVGFGESSYFMSLTVSPSVVVDTDGTSVVYVEANGVAFSKYGLVPSWTLNGADWGTTETEFSIGLDSLATGGNDITVTVTYNGDEYSRTGTVAVTKYDSAVEATYPTVQYKLSSSSTYSEDENDLIVYTDSAGTSYALTIDGYGLTLNNNDDEWLEYVPSVTSTKPYVWVRYWNLTTKTWDTMCWNGETGEAAKFLYVTCSQSCVYMDEKGLTKAQELVFTATGVGLVSGSPSISWTMSDDGDAGAVTYSTSEESLDETGTAWTSTLTVTVAAGLSLGYIKAIAVLSRTETVDYVETTVQYLAPYLQVDAVQDGENAVSYVLTASSGTFVVDEDGLTTGGKIEFYCTTQNIDVASVEWKTSSGLAAYITWGTETVSAEYTAEKRTRAITFNTGLSLSEGYIRCVVTDTDGNTYDTNCCYFYAVAEGTDAKLVLLTASPATIDLDEDGLARSQTVTFTRTLVNIEQSSISWTHSTVSGVTWASGSSSLTATLAYGYEVASLTASCTVTAANGDVFESNGLTVLGVKEGATGADAVAITLTASPVTYTLTTRGVTANETQTVAVTLNRSNITSTAYWTVSTTLVSYSVSGDVMTVTIPSLISLDSFTVSVVVGTLSASLEVEGVKTGVAEAMYVLTDGSGVYSSSSSFPTTTEEGPLILGDHVLLEGSDGTRTPYYWTGTTWAVAGTSGSVTDEVAWKIMQDTLYDALAAEATADTTSVINSFAKNLAAYTAFIYSLQVRNLRVGTGSTSSGFMLRACDYEDGTELSTPLFDVWYGGKCVFKVAPESGNVFFGEPNEDASAPVSGFMYNASTESIEGVGVSFGSDGTITASNTLTVSGNLEVTGTGLISSDVTFGGNILNNMMEVTQVSEEGETLAEKTISSSTGMAYTLATGYFPAGSVVGTTLTVNGTTTEVWVKSTKSTTTVTHITYYDGGNTSESYTVGTFSVYRVGFYSDSDCTSQYTLSSLGFATTSGKASAGSNSNKNTTYGYKFSYTPSSTYYLYYCSNGYYWNYSNYAITFTTYMTDGVFRLISLPVTSDDLDEDEDEGRVYVASDGSLHWYAPSKGYT